MLMERINKETLDISRITADMSWWLDPNETITEIVSSQVITGMAGWSEAPYPPRDRPQPYDPTPLLLLSSALDAPGQNLTVFVEYGTAGVAYTVQFLLRGSSMRQVTIELGVQVTGVPPEEPLPVPVPIPPMPQGALALSIYGGIMEGPLYLFRDPLYPTEAATKNYVDTHGALYLPISGGAMTGPLTLSGNATQPLHAVPLQQMQAATASPAIINVLDHGAVGDGVTDDSAAIYNALIVYAGKATILLPAPNIFRVSYLFVPSNTDLVINGTLKAIDGDNEPVLFLNNVSNIRISGYGTLDGNKANVVPNCAGINMSNCTNVQVSGITILNTFYWALNIGGSKGIRIDNVTVIGSGAGSEFATGSDDCWLTNCTFDGTESTDAGFTFYGGVTNSGAIGNTIKNTGIGVSQANLGLCILADGNPGDATAQGCSNIILADNLCFNNGASGIWVDVHVATIHNGIIIANNRCYDNCQFGGDSADIHIGNANDVTVIGNQSQRCKYPYGIYSANNVAQGRHLITGNYVIDAGYGGPTTGVGLYVDSTPHVTANGNYFFSPSGSMQAWLGGTAGANNVFIGNYGGGIPRTITLQSDSVCANAEGGGVYQYAPGTVLQTASPMQIANNTATGVRWYIGQDGATESGGGSNTGSNYEIISVSDAGSLLLQCLSINRATALATFGGSVLVNGSGIAYGTGPGSNAIAFKWTSSFQAALYVDGQNEGNIVTNLRAGLASQPSYANDAAAAAGGVSVDQLYRNGSVVQVRVT